ncbi:type-IV b secretion system, inner-membrane complex component (plasmid) [Marinobacter salarius]|uniref:Type-IV b secretion system, inner-membrane complex component n=2 Tax=Marinobacter salarius TaxID=1420917 RepID=A0A1W6KFV1_9GAMM|nr:type-IV b secretion system, inner-membrane complex component [Marinobacter salarius]
MIHGAEALAALTVSESKLSRFKSRGILGLLLLCVGLIFWIAALQASQPEPKLLGMTVDGRIQELPLLDEPLESRQILMDWTRRNIPDLYDWNYANFRAELNKARDFVQKITLEEFTTDLEDSGILPKVRQDFLILRANITNEPLIVNETVTSGRRLYVMEIPMTLVYDSGDVEAGQRRQINQDILFTAWIVRASILKYDGGLMLAKYAIKQRN